MLSPHTPPGTRVVCIDDVKDGRYATRTVHNFDLNGLRLGEVYTVSAIAPNDGTTSGFIAVLVEIVRPGRTKGFALERFRRVDLPECLTSLLNVAPTDSGADKSITAEG